MSKTFVNASIRLSKADILQIEELMELFGESRTVVMKKALWDLHNKVFNDKKAQENEK